jgi:dipeptidase E
VKLLLTSAGLSNAAIRGALEQLLGKPLSRSRAVYIPTAIHAVPDGVEYGWEMQRSLLPAEWGGFGILELTALPSLPREHWMPSLTAADAVLVGGGNTPFLSFWVRRSGMVDVLPGILQSAVYVGVSAGTLLAGSGFHIDQGRLQREGVYDDDLYGDAAPVGFGSNETFGFVDFAIMPHLDSPDFDDMSLNRITQNTTGPTYVLDDQSAVMVVDHRVTVISEGSWQYLPGRM